jgi:outer membrane biosynthesis protein TonB
MPVPPRRRLAALVAATLLAAPAPALAQSAGDEQYEDPFAGENQSQPEPTPTPTPTPAPAEPEPATSAPAPESTAEPTAPAPAAAPASQPQQLPRTGLEAVPILAAGAVMLAGGVALRVRLRERS